MTPDEIDAAYLWASDAISIAVANLTEVLAGGGWPVDKLTAIPQPTAAYVIATLLGLLKYVAESDEILRDVLLESARVMGLHVAQVQT